MSDDATPPGNGREVRAARASLIAGRPIVRYGDVTTLTRNGTSAPRTTKARARRREPLTRTMRYAACGLTLTANAPIPGLGLAGDDAAANVGVVLHPGEPLPAAGPSDDAWYVSAERDERGTPLLVAATRTGGWQPLAALQRGRGVPGRRRGRRGGGVVGSRRSPTPTPQPICWDRCWRSRCGCVASCRCTRAAWPSTDGRCCLPAIPAPASPPPRRRVRRSGSRCCRTTSCRSRRPMPARWRGRATRASVCGPMPPRRSSPIAGRCRRYSATYDKRYLDLGAAALPFQRTPLPLGRVLVLAGPAPAAGPAIRPLGAREGLVALLRHTYGTYLIDMGMRAREFDVLARLVDAVPVCEVRFAAGRGHAWRHNVPRSWSASGDERA